jgi:hypothetical protein
VIDDFFIPKEFSYSTIFFLFFLFTELEICSETDSTNECSDFKSELDDELEGDPNQQRLQSAVVPSSVGSGSTGAGSSQSAVSASGQDRVPAGQGAPRKSSGGGRKNTRVVFVWLMLKYAKIIAKKSIKLLCQIQKKMDLTERKIFFHSAVLQDRPYGNYNASPTERTMLNL